MSIIQTHDGAVTEEMLLDFNMENNLLVYVIMLHNLSYTAKRFEHVKTISAGSKTLFR